MLVLRTQWLQNPYSFRCTMVLNDMARLTSEALRPQVIAHAMPVVFYSLSLKLS